MNLPAAPSGLRLAARLAAWPRKLLRSPALSAAAAFGFGGVGFAVASLLLARSLSPFEFGVFTLTMGLLNVGLLIAPLGADGAINRARVRPSFWLLRRALKTSLAVALAASLLGGLLYGLDAEVLAILFAGVAVGGLNTVAGACLQSQQRFFVALWLTQAGHMVLLPAAALAVIVHLEEATVPLACLVGGHVCGSALGWRILLGGDTKDSSGCSRFGWLEPLSYAGVALTDVLLTSLERLIVPKVLSLEDLAVYGVLATVVIGPFRMLQLGVGYTLLPRLRATSSGSERRRLLAQEAAVAGVLCLLGAMTVYILAPIVVDAVLMGKYELFQSLLLAGIVSSLLRVASGFAKGAVTALCSTRELALLNGLMWLAVGVAIAGAVAGAAWGLVGVIYGASLGWASRIVVSAALAGRHLFGD